MKLIDKFEAMRADLYIAHEDALSYPVGARDTAEKEAVEVWGIDFIDRVWERNPETAWADFFIAPNLDVLLIVGEQALDTDGKFYVAVFEQPIQVEKFGDDRLYIYFDKALTSYAMGEKAHNILKLVGYDAGEWNLVDIKDASETGRDIHCLIFEKE